MVQIGPRAKATLIHLLRKHIAPLLGQADVLGADNVNGSFDPLELLALAWFPWLNQRHGYYRPSRWVRSLLWTVLLTPAVLVLHVPLLFARKGGWLRRLADRVLADVTNYITSARQATFPGSELKDATGTVQARFAATVDAAPLTGYASSCRQATPSPTSVIRTPSRLPAGNQSAALEEFRATMSTA